MRPSTISPCLVFAVGCLLVASSATCRCLHADEPTLSSHIARVSLFKNGLALIERRATPQAVGVYQLDEAPRPVHGTMWVEGDRRLIARVAVRQRDQGPQRPNDLQQDYAGRKVTVYLQDVPQAIQGTVRDLAKPKVDAASPMSSYRPQPSSSRRFLVLDVADGEALLDINRILYLQAEGKSQGTKRSQPVLLLEVGREAVGKEVRIRYLTQGISWAPSYHVDLLGPNRLRIGQTALVRNELTDLQGADIQLISGFPNIRFRHVTSPLAPEANWAQFFSQLNQRPSQGGNVLGNVAMQQVAFNTVAPAASGIDLSATPSGEGVDLHYQSVGRRSLGKDEALQLEVASAEAEYRRIVEWIVPDTHDAYGNRVDSRGQRNEEGEGEPWDALQFRNPLPMPMTTGPATITADGQFNGQTISYWVNRGELNTLKVTKALSVRAMAIENEKQNTARNNIYIGGRHYVRVDVEGRLSINNHRAEPVDLVIRRRFSGELLRADEDPQTSLLEEGAYSVNRRNELIWKLRLEAGQAQDLKYEYRLLVRR